MPHARAANRTWPLEKTQVLPGSDSCPCRVDASGDFQIGMVRFGMRVGSHARGGLAGGLILGSRTAHQSKRQQPDAEQRRDRNVRTYPTSIVKLLQGHAAGYIHHNIRSARGCRGPGSKTKRSAVGSGAAVIGSAAGRKKAGGAVHPCRPRPLVFSKPRGSHARG